MDKCYTAAANQLAIRIVSQCFMHIILLTWWICLILIKAPQF